MSFFEEVKSRTVILRYKTTRKILWLWENILIEDWPYIVTNYTVLDDMREEIKERFNVKGHIQLVDEYGHTITKPEQLARRGVYTIVVDDK